LADADGEVLALTVELRDLRAQEELRAQERHLFSAKSLETEHQLRDARATLTEQNLEILALSAELRAQERDVCRKDATIADQERDVCRKDATIADLVNQLATLAARINDNAQRSYMIQEMLYCPPNVLDAMQKALLPELPELPELPSNPLPSRDRSRTPRGDAPKLLKFPTP
jgi:chromosome segregation ATPase